MSFVFDSVAIPFWFIIFIIASATPLWFQWYKIFHKKFIVTGILKRKFKRAKSAAEMKVDILKKATDHWNENSELSGFAESKSEVRKGPKKKIDPVKKKNITNVLKILAENKETGVLAKAVADKTKISSIEASGALTYLVDKKYAELVNSTNGTKYYLTDLGRRYCINKRYL